LIDNPFSDRFRFVWRQPFNCVSNFVGKPIGSTDASMHAHQDEGGREAAR
jgi:hypothetical protein